MAHQASSVIETFETVSGVTVTLIQVIFTTGGVQYYAKAEYIDEFNEIYKTLWSDWFTSLTSAQVAIDALAL